MKQMRKRGEENGRERESRLNEVFCEKFNRQVLLHAKKVFVSTGRSIKRETPFGDFYLTEQEDDLLKSGYYQLKNSPWKLRQLEELLAWMLHYCFGGSVHEMSEALQTAFPNVKEYKREKLYEWLPILRKDKAERELDRMLDKVVKTGLEKKLWELFKSRQLVGTSTESLGSPETEVIDKMDKLTPRERLGSKLGGELDDEKRLKRHKKAMSKVRASGKRMEEIAKD
jgi:hypothetical protein